MLQKIQHFDKLVINYSKKLQEHDIELNNQVYKKKGNINPNQPKINKSVNQ
jgi:hypothetical protein